MILLTFAFDSRFELMSEPRSKVVDYYSSSRTLHQELASTKRLETYEQGRHTDHK